MIPTPPQANLMAEAVLVLQSIRDLKQKYAVNYVLQVLQGRSAFIRQNEHLELAVFGKMADWHPDHIRQLVLHLLELGYLEILDARYGRLGLTETGEAYLDTPQELNIDWKKLQKNIYENRLHQELRKIRKDLSAKEASAPFRIFTDYTIEQLIKLRPLNLKDLQEVPGFGDYKANRYGPAVLRVIQQVEAQEAEDRQLALLRKVSRPSYQSVKAFFEAGLDEQAIAQKRLVKPSTVRRMLLELHRAGEVDLLPWIETEIPNEPFKQATDYFRQAEDQRLKTAYEALGLEYDTLRLCRLYVSNVDSRQEELKAAG
jgi:ATP-dependent DNA helicase RecQ